MASFFNDVQFDEKKFKPKEIPLKFWSYPNERISRLQMLSRKRIMLNCFNLDCNNDTYIKIVMTDMLEKHLCPFCKRKMLAEEGAPLKLVLLNHQKKDCPQFQTDFKIGNNPVDNLTTHLRKDSKFIPLEWYMDTLLRIIYWWLTDGDNKNNSNNKEQKDNNEQEDDEEQDDEDNDDEDNDEEDNDEEDNDDEDNDDKDNNDEDNDDEDNDDEENDDEDNDEYNTRSSKKNNEVSKKRKEIDETEVKQTSAIKKKPTEVHPSTKESTDKKEEPIKPTKESTDKNDNNSEDDETEIEEENE